MNREKGGKYIHILYLFIFIITFSHSNLVLATSATTTNGVDLVVITADDGDPYCMDIDEYLSKLGANVTKLTNNTAFTTSGEYNQTDGIVLIGYQIDTTLRKTMFSTGQWDAIKSYVSDGGKLIVWHGDNLAYDIASDYYNDGGANLWTYNGTINLNGDDPVYNLSNTFGTNTTLLNLRDSSSSYTSGGGLKLVGALNSSRKALVKCYIDTDYDNAYAFLTHGNFGSGDTFLHMVGGDLSWVSSFSKDYRTFAKPLFENLIFQIYPVLKDNRIAHADKTYIIVQVDDIGDSAPNWSNMVSFDNNYPISWGVVPRTLTNETRIADINNSLINNGGSVFLHGDYRGHYPYIVNDSYSQENAVGNITAGALWIWDIFGVFPEYAVPAGNAFNTAGLQAVAQATLSESCVRIFSHSLGIVDSSYGGINPNEFKAWNSTVGLISIGTSHYNPNNLEKFKSVVAESVLGKHEPIHVWTHPNNGFWEEMTTVFNAYEDNPDVEFININEMLEKIPFIHNDEYNGTITLVAYNSTLTRYTITDIEEPIWKYFIINQTITRVTLNSIDYTYFDDNKLSIKLPAGNSTMEIYHDGSTNFIHFDTDKRIEILNATIDEGLLGFYGNSISRQKLSAFNTRYAFRNSSNIIYMNGTIDALMNFSQHNSDSQIRLIIIPSTGWSSDDYRQFMSVNISDWSVSGNYYKKWTETPTNATAVVNHTIGDLNAHTKYNVVVDGSAWGTYTSNASGFITFSYDGGYSTKIFEIVQYTPPTTSPPGSSGGGGIFPQTWTKTISPTDEELHQGFVIDLKAKERVALNISGEVHYIGVKKLTKANTTISILSDEKMYVLNLGEEIQSDVNDDGIRDVIVRLNSIADNKANIFFQTIEENISENGEGEESVSEQGETIYRMWNWMKLYNWKSKLSLSAIVIVVIISLLIWVISKRDTIKYFIYTKYDNAI